MNILNFKKYIKILFNFGIFAFVSTLLSRFRINFNLKIKDHKKINKLLNLLKIYKTNFKLLKIGDNNDGTYIVPKILHKINYCISIGVGDTVTFENHLYKKYKIKSFLIDNTINGEVIRGKKGLNFFKKNLSLFNDEKHITLDNLLNKCLKKQNQKNLLLQADIEGDENYIIHRLSDKLLDKFSVMIFEFHFLSIISSKKGLERVLKIFSKIEKNFTLVYIHPNNIFTPFKVNGYSLPCLAEITFLNNKQIKNKEIFKSKDIFKFKNIKDYKQIKLEKFHFTNQNIT